MHVHDILRKMSNVMLLTYAAQGEPSSLNGRPLHVTSIEDDDTLWFVVGRDSKKVQEIEVNSEVQITGQDGMRWIHASGTADVVTDRDRVHALWNKMHEVWFPKGPADPNVCLLRVCLRSAEYWDNSGLPGMKYLFEAARALLTGTAVRPVKGTHGEVTK